MHWKPIPTRDVLDSIFGDDGFCAALFLHLLVNASDIDKGWTDKRGKSIVLKRGQVVFGRNQYAKYMGLEATQSGRVERALEKLQKVHKQIDKQVTHDWTLVTVINYDLLCPNTQANRQAIDKQQTSNRHVYTYTNTNTKKIAEFPLVEKKYPREKYDWEFIGNEFIKMEAWMNDPQKNKGGKRLLSERFALNWLEKSPPPLARSTPAPFTITLT